MTVTAVPRPLEKPGTLVAHNDPSSGNWFFIDPEAMGEVHSMSMRMSMGLSVSKRTRRANAACEWWALQTRIAGVHRGRAIEICVWQALGMPFTPPFCEVFGASMPFHALPPPCEPPRPRPRSRFRGPRFAFRSFITLPHSASSPDRESDPPPHNPKLTAASKLTSNTTSKLP